VAIETEDGTKPDFVMLTVFVVACTAAVDIEAPMARTAARTGMSKSLRMRRILPFGTATG
jgi:hypothetical protein